MEWETVRQSLNFFTFAMLELTILFVGISFIVGCINEFLPQEKVKRVLSGRKGRGYVVGAALGGLTPFCSCSTIPMMVGLLKAGAGFGPTMSFLFASPLVNPVLLGLFLTLLGMKVTFVYALLALSLAITSGYILEKLGFSRYVKDGEAVREGGCGCESTPSPTPQLTIQSMEAISPLGGSAKVDTQTSEACCVSPATSTDEIKTGRWVRIFQEAVDQFKRFFPYMVLGVAIGAVIHGFIPAQVISQHAGSDNIFAIPISALIGIPLYIRASTMLPIAASLVAKGMSLGAVIALIIGGAGASLPEVTMLKGLFRWPLLGAFLAAVFITAVTSGLIMNAVM
ncbi:MAG: permease [Desulfocapsaceae bacterium]|nr:permease [Desulfocapsaceae bacterium]